MKRAQYTERGPDPQASITMVESATPEPASGQALLEVLAAPINPSDVLTLTGLYGMLPALPAVGGNEGVGRVLALGPDTQGPAIGQTVLLPVGCGTWATHVLADAKSLMPLPNDADPLQLAMMTVNPPTALLMLREFVDLQPGEWVIQNAANSGVGAYLIQLAKARGLKTVNVVRRESAVAGVCEIGGDVVLVDAPDLAKRVREATGAAAIRLGIDAVGGASTDRLAMALADGGVLVNYGAMSGEPCQVSPASFVFRDLSLRGFWLSKWFIRATPAQRTVVFDEVASLIASGRLKSRIQATYPIDQIKDAVAAAAAGERKGKILLVPNG
ncbi:zinc-dependent alcohol dehydrogenase family protein [Arenimonas sp.]|jgi:NADPH:quinone reductase-like Zn-dependent oxidoreductase|uniref:zinc-dependent alcohol dehydrogenase family protein n=1 Tax=Arenimonas sp. TaxID=1872635 RepID=UPI0037BEC040